jgi:hypothetical protein
VDTLECSAFAGCSVTQIVIPRSVQYLQSKSFAKCLLLTTVTFDFPRVDTEVSATAFDRYSFILQSNRLPPYITIVAKDSNPSTAGNHPFIGDRFHNPNFIPHRSFSPSIVEQHRIFEDCKLIANITRTFLTTVD